MGRAGNSGTPGTPQWGDLVSPQGSRGPPETLAPAGSVSTVQGGWGPSLHRQDSGGRTVRHPTSRRLRAGKRLRAEG